jgi:DHA1 family multidrug resistance protein-like MFS transporter
MQYAIRFSWSDSVTRANNRKNVWILAFTLFVVMLGFGVIIPILPFYVERMGAGGTELGLLVASYAVMRLICGPLWGSLSDRVGRKPILLIGILGYAITMFWFGLATELWMLFAARILSGILSSATAPTTMAYIGDSTTDKERSGGMGILGAAGGLGTIFGPAAGGLLAGGSLALPFFIAGGMALLALALAALFLPESLPAEARAEAAAGREAAGPSAWRQALFSPLGILFVLTFVSTCGLMIFANVFGLYALQRFGFGPEEVGVIMMVLGLASALAQGVLVGPLTVRWGEVVVIRAGLAASALGFGLMLLANDFVTIVLATAFFGVATALQVPALTSLTSQRATLSQGITMGLSNAFISLGRIVGPLVAGVIFDVNIVLPYLVGAGVMLVGVAISLALGREQRSALRQQTP